MAHLALVWCVIVTFLSFICALAGAGSLQKADSDFGDVVVFCVFAVVAFIGMFVSYFIGTMFF